MTNVITQVARPFSEPAFNELDQEKTAQQPVEAHLTLATSLPQYITEFPDYVMTFYGAGGLYDQNFTLSEIIEAIEVRKDHPNLKNIPFDGDSFDRELVRDIVLKKRDPKAEIEYDV